VKVRNVKKGEIMEEERVRRREKSDEKKKNEKKDKIWRKLKEMVEGKIK
jgi:hypothetical protein